jgi:anti-sigma factor RsiW
MGAADIGRVVSRVQDDVNSCGAQFVMQSDFRKTRSNPVREDVVGENPPARRILDRSVRSRRWHLLETRTDPAATIGKGLPIAMWVKEASAVAANLERPVSEQRAQWYFCGPTSQQLVSDDHTIVFEEI